MTVGISFYAGDAELFFKQLGWIEQLSQRPGGSLRDVRCVLVTNGVKRSTMSAARNGLKAVYDAVDIIPLDGTIREWPQAQNLCFSAALKRVNSTDDMLWLETDVVPLRDSWMREIREEWGNREYFHTFMGTLMEHTYCNHVSGVALYSRNWRGVCPKLADPSQLAWDVQHADKILPYAKFSNLIQQRFGAVAPVTLADLDPRAVLFHQDKSGHLIDLLRDKLPEVPKPKKSAASILKWDRLA